MGVSMALGKRHVEITKKIARADCFAADNEHPRWKASVLFSKLVDVL